MAWVRLIGETASQKGSRPPTFGWSLLIAPITHPPWAWGSNPDPPLDTSVFMHRSGSRVLNSAFVASRADCGSWGGGACALGLAAGRQQADHGPGIGAGKRLALKPRNCRL